MSDRAKQGQPHCFQRTENSVMMRVLSLLDSDAPNSAEELFQILKSSYSEKEKIKSKPADQP